MPSFNERLKRISLREVLIVIILSYALIFSLRFFNVMDIDDRVVNLVVILFFAVRLKDYSDEFKHDVSNIFSVVPLKEILVVVMLNIFFSYGMLYLSNYLIQLVPADAFFVPFKSIDLGAGIFPLISVVLISPVAEELLFRGVFLNKFRLIVPMVFSILASSLFFALLHTFGGIISAFVFGICMAILYLKTDNILVPIFAHFINNLLSEAIYHVDNLNLLFSEGTVMILVSGLAVISFIVLFKYMKSNLKNIY